jgi:hypothetical protein
MCSRFFFSLILLCSWSSWAADISVTWFQPFHFSPPFANYTKVVIYGKTSPGATLSINKESVVTENPEFVEKFAKLAKGDILQSAADQGGYFQMSLSLPQGLVQIPIVVTAEDKSMTYVISLQIEKGKVTASVPISKDEPEVAEWRDAAKKFAEKKYGLGLPLANKLSGLWASLGVGINYQSLSQTLSGGTELKFQNINLPSVGVRMTWNQPRWLANFDYKYQPGTVSQVSAPFTASSSSYAWTSLTAEGGYNLRNDYFGERSRFTLLAGCQFHQMPFFRVNFGNTIDERTLSLTTLSVGPMFVLEMGPKYLFEVYMHYQQHLSASILDESNFSVTTKFAFDGSIGVLRKFNEKHNLGLFWLGQWHRYDFTYRDVVTQLDNQGQQNLFYSNLDLRYIWHF